MGGGWDEGTGSAPLNLTAFAAIQVEMRRHLLSVYKANRKFVMACLLTSCLRVRIDLLQYFQGRRYRKNK